MTSEKPGGAASLQRLMKKPARLRCKCKTNHIPNRCVQFEKMRDNHENMIELLDVSKAENIYSSLIRNTINGENLNLRFGIEKSDYARLKRILEFRPFENTGVSPYRYFFSLSYSSDSKNELIAITSVRVEQLERNKQYEFELSKKYISNILWFNEINDKKEIEQLIEK